MSAAAAQFQFAAEFVSFLAAAGLTVVAIRRDLTGASRPARAGLAAGTVLLAAVAFAHGSLLVRHVDAPALVAGRLAGAALLGAALLAWTGGAASRWMLAGGAALAGLAALVGAAGAGRAASVAVAASGVSIAAAFVYASRGSIAARVAASAAMTLLLVVLVLAVALSAVVVRTVRHEAVRRLEGRAHNEAGVAAASYTPQLAAAKVVAGSLAGSRQQELARPDSPGALASLNAALTALSDNFYQGTQLLVVGAGPRVLAVANVGGNATATAIAGSDVVRQALRTGEPTGSVQVVGAGAVSVGTLPIKATVDGQFRLLAVVVALSPLDHTYLETRRNDDRTIALELVGRDGVLATAGPELPPNAAQSLGRSVIDSAAPASRTVGARFVVAEPVLAGASNRPVVTLIASTPTSVVDSSRDSLFRTLFLIALGGTLLALLLAAFVGERIGAGLRRLTTAAEGIQGGDLSVRAGIGSDDEVGRLGAAFDSMAASIQEKTVEEAGLRNRLEAVVAGMGEALVAVDGAGRITDFNRAAEELVGVTASAARGALVDEVVALTTEEGAPLGRRLRNPAPAQWSAQGWVDCADGARVPVAVLGGPLRDAEGELAGGVFVLRDLRREREVERMKTEFLSRIGHELRTPLTGIIGYADLLARRKVPATLARQWHETILAQSKALERIIQMLEFFASSGAGRLALRPEEVDVRSLVDEAAARWAPRLDKSHPVARRVARGVPKVLVDRRWIDRSLDELVDNAVKFSPAGGRIELTATVSDNGKPGVEISVVDRGAGMSEEAQRAVFADFVQGDASDTRSAGGLGLGLSLVQRVAEAHGGAVSVSSKPGKGSKVSIFLPAMPMKKRKR